MRGTGAAAAAAAAASAAVRRRGVGAAAVVMMCQILPLPIYIPKQLGLRFNKINQQLLLSILSNTFNII
jgi:hypothetical protein